jgi:uncharacterized protein
MTLDEIRTAWDEGALTEGEAINLLIIGGAEEADCPPALRKTFLRAKYGWDHMEVFLFGSGYTASKKHGMG